MTIIKELLTEAALQAVGGPQAAAGYYAAKTIKELTRKSKNMAPVDNGKSTKRRKRGYKQCKITDAATPQYFVRSFPTSRPRRIGRVRDNTSNGSVIQRGATRSGRRVSKTTGRKKIKVPKRLRKQVKEVLKSSSPSGYYQERFYEKFTPVSVQQLVVDLGGGNFNGEFGTADARLWFFDPARVINVASTLFNGKVPVANKTSSAVSSANLFDRSNIQIDVLRQWVEFNIKNNSARSIEVKLWTWELKKPGATAADAAQSLGDFATEWANSFASETLRTISGSVAASTTGLNTLAITPNVIGTSPGMSHAMRDKYSIEEKIIMLEPGRTYKHQVQGPRKVYDFGKFNQGATFINGIKGIKGLCMGISVDNTSTSTFGAGNSHRITNMENADPYGILVETIYNYVIRMPEQTGFKVGAALAVGDNVPMNYRRDKPYAVKIWNQPGSAEIGTVSEVNEENPVQTTFTLGT